MLIDNNNHHATAGRILFVSPEGIHTAVAVSRQLPSLLFPFLSLGNGAAVLVNFGQRAFKFVQSKERWKLKIAQHEEPSCMVSFSATLGIRGSFITNQDNVLRSCRANKSFDLESKSNRSYFEVTIHSLPGENSTTFVHHYADGFI